MMFSLFFTRACGTVAVLKVRATDAGRVQSWSSWSLTGKRVNLEPGDKWVALGTLHAEAQRVALGAVAGGAS